MFVFLCAVYAASCVLNNNYSQSSVILILCILAGQAKILCTYRAVPHPLCHDNILRGFKADFMEQKPFQSLNQQLQSTEGTDSDGIIMDLHNTG